MNRHAETNGDDGVQDRQRPQLTFARLRDANVARCEDAFHQIDAWSLTDWATALAGELGEACNIIKKLRRLDIRSGFTREGEGNAAALLIELARELADAQIYMDLTAAAANINLADAVVAKFNETSNRIGSRVML